MSEESFESILNRPFRWPRESDRPFTRSVDPRGNAYIDRFGHGRTVLMMTGYKNAADLLVRQSTQSGFDRDTLVYPIVFNYRQFIELSLKYLIATYGRTVGIDANWKTHDLSVLWSTFAQTLERYGHDDPDQTDPVVARIVGEFAKVDPGSFSYRYPVDRQGNPIPLAHEELDLAQLADVMNGLDGYFTGCDGYLDHLQGAGP